MVLDHILFGQVLFGHRFIMYFGAEVLNKVVGNTVNDVQDYVMFAIKGCILFILDCTKKSTIIPNHVDDI